MAPFLFRLIVFYSLWIFTEGTYCYPHGPLQASNVATRLTSPNFLESYPRNQDCKWTLDSGDDRLMLNIDIRYIDMESCSHNNLTIYDGDSTQSTTLAVVCRQRLSIRSRGRYVTVRFQSGDVDQGNGFLLYYCTTNGGTSGGCADSDPVINIPVLSVSVNLSLPYTQRQTAPTGVYEWLLTAYTLPYIVVTIVNKGEECIVLHSGQTRTSPEIGRICGKNEQTFRSPSNVVFISLTSGSIKGLQFYLGFVAVDSAVDCIPTVPATRIYNSDHSPQYITYQDGHKNNVVYESWLILKESSSDRLEIDVVNSTLYDAHTCPRDSVTVYGGYNNDCDAVAIGHFCGPHTTIFRDDRYPLIFLKFMTNDPASTMEFTVKFSLCSSYSWTQPCSESNAFYASYSTRYILPPTCLLCANRGSLKWTIQRPDVGRIKSYIILTIEYLYLESNNCGSVLTVYYGNSDMFPEAGRLCGEAEPTTYSSSGTSMFIRLSEFRSVAFRGFNISYTLVPENVGRECLGVMASHIAEAQLHRQMFYSVNYPREQTLSVTETKWLIYSRQSNVIVVELDILTGQSYMNDAVKLYSDSCRNDPITSTGSENTFISRTGIMLVVFEANVNRVSWPGFTLTYYTFGQEVTTTATANSICEISQELYSENTAKVITLNSYLVSAGDITRCWIIRAPVSNVVFITVTDIVHVRLYLYDGEWTTSELIDSFVQTGDRDKRYSSTGNSMLLVGNYDPQYSYHLNITYQKLPLAPPQCSSYYFPSSHIRGADTRLQYIQSATLRNRYGRITDHWLIIKPVLTKLTMKVIDSNIRSSEGCKDDWIKMSVLADYCEESSELGTYCSSSDASYQYSGELQYLLVTFSVMDPGIPSRFRMSFTTGDIDSVGCTGTPIEAIVLPIIGFIVIVAAAVIIIVRKRKMKQDRIVNSIRDSQRRRREIQNLIRSSLREHQNAESPNMAPYMANVTSNTAQPLSLGSLQSAELPPYFAVIPLSHVYCRNPTFDDTEDPPSYEDAIVNYIIPQKPVNSISSNAQSECSQYVENTTDRIGETVNISGEGSDPSPHVGNLNSNRYTDFVHLEHSVPVQLPPPRYSRNGVEIDASVGRMTPPPNYNSIEIGTEARRPRTINSSEIETIGDTPRAIDNMHDSRTAEQERRRHHSHLQCRTQNRPYARGARLTTSSALNRIDESDIATNSQASRSLSSANGSTFSEPVNSENSVSTTDQYRTHIRNLPSKRFHSNSDSARNIGVELNTINSESDTRRNTSETRLSSPINSTNDCETVRNRIPLELAGRSGILETDI